MRCMWRDVPHHPCAVCSTRFNTQLWNICSQCEQKNKRRCPLPILIKQHGERFHSSAKAKKLSWCLLTVFIYFMLISSKIKRIVWHCGKYDYLLSCRELDATIDTVPIYCTTSCLNSKYEVKGNSQPGSVRTKLNLSINTLTGYTVLNLFNLYKSEV